MVLFQASVREHSILSTLPLLIVNNFTLTAQPVYVVFWIILFLLLLPPPVIIFQRRFTALSYPLPTSFPDLDNRPPGLFPHLPPLSLYYLSLRPALCACFCCHVPRPFSPPLSPLSCAQVPVGPLGVIRRWSLRLLPRLYPSPCEFSSLVIFWCLVSFSSGGIFRMRRQGA